MATSVTVVATLGFPTASTAVIDTVYSSNVGITVGRVLVSVSWSFADAMLMARMNCPGDKELPVETNRTATAPDGSLNSITTDDMLSCNVYCRGTDVYMYVVDVSGAMTLTVCVTESCVTDVTEADT
jgi:hypothetical protein